jgi:hypothetical protein
VFELGKKAKDKITGFEGIITGHADYLYGCDQYLISAEAKDGNSEPQSYWFDEGRIKITGDGILPSEVQVEENGGPNMNAPNRY